MWRHTECYRALSFLHTLPPITSPSILSKLDPLLACPQLPNILTIVHNLRLGRSNSFLFCRTFTLLHCFALLNLQILCLPVIGKSAPRFTPAKSETRSFPFWNAASITSAPFTSSNSYTSFTSFILKFSDLLSIPPFPLQYLSADSQRDLLAAT